MIALGIFEFKKSVEALVLQRGSTTEVVVY